MFSYSEIRIKQVFPKRRKKLDYQIIANRKDDNRSISRICAITKAHKSASWQPMSLADNLHCLHPNAASGKQQYVICKIAYRRQKRFRRMHAATVLFLRSILPCHSERSEESLLVCPYCPLR